MNYCFHSKELLERKQVMEFLGKHASEVRPASYRNTRTDFKSKMGITELRHLATQAGLHGIICYVSDSSYGVG